MSRAFNILLLADPSFEPWKESVGSIFTPDNLLHFFGIEENGGRPTRSLIFPKRNLKSGDTLTH